MEHFTGLEIIRLRAALASFDEDARLWRWFADQMEDHRLVFERRRQFWHVRCEGRALACDRSFDVAVRKAYALSHALAVV